MIRAFWWLLIAAPSLAANPAVQGQLCVGRDAESFRSDEAECRVIEDSHTPIAAPAPRLFVFVSADKKIAVFGRLEPDSNFGEASSGSVRVTLRIESGSRTSPRNAELILRTAGKPIQWRWTLSKEITESLQEIRLPPSNYEATVTAPHHEPLELKIDARAKVDLGRLRLRPLPILAGKVIDRATRAPIAGALITADSGKTIGVTDVAGEFREELAPGNDPLSITVAFGGYGARTIALPHARVDRVLPPIELDAGGSLHVMVIRDKEKYRTVSVDVARVEGRKQVRARHGELVAGAEWIANDLDPGDYMVTIGGAQPLQRVGRAVAIKATQVAQLEVKIEPIDLVGTVSRGKTRVAHAEITLKSHHGGWESVVTTNEEGTFEEELWQGGRFLAAVSVGGANAPYLFVDEIHDDPCVRWNIKIPSGTVSGRVVDARSRKPIAGASITLDSELPDDSNKSLGTTADESGRFAFDGVSAGMQSVYAEAPKYLTSAPQRFVFSQDDERKDLEVSLTPAARYPLLVVGTDDRPVAGAFVVYAGLLEGELPVTDGQGRVDLDLDPNLGALMAILPRSGSFALYRVPPAAEIPDTPVRIVVPPPAASLAIRAEDDATGMPVPNTRLLIRYNGEFLPPALALFIGRLRAVQFTADRAGQLFFADLPPGMYELWPYLRSNEAAEIMQGRKAPAAALPLTAGAYSATLKVSSGHNRSNGIEIAK
jgi:hypothetical protein